MHDNAKNVFGQIASQTGGKCEYLDVNSDRGQEMLLQFFITNILEMVGKESGDQALGKKMVADYMSCFK